MEIALHDVIDEIRCLIPVRHFVIPSGVPRPTGSLTDPFEESLLQEAIFCIAVHANDAGGEVCFEPECA